MMKKKQAETIHEKFLLKEEKSLVNDIKFICEHKLEIETIYGKNSDNEKRLFSLIDELNDGLATFTFIRKSNSINDTDLKGVCDKCDDVVDVDVIGEAMGEDGYIVNKLFCRECKNEFLDLVPKNNDDFIKWADEVIKYNKEIIEKPENKSKLKASELKDIKEFIEELEFQKAEISEKSKLTNEIENEEKYFAKLVSQSLKQLDEVKLLIKEIAK